MRKKTIMTIITAMTAGALIGGGTLAYFTDQDEVTNTFTVGALDIEEKEPDWEDKTDGKKLIPGSVRYKNPTIYNVTTEEKGANACYCRMMVDLLDENNNRIEDQERIDKIWETICYDEDYKWDEQTRTGTSTNLIEGDENGVSRIILERMKRVSPKFVEDTSASIPKGRRIFNYIGDTADNGILKAGSSATLFTTIAIPTEWKQEDLDLIGSYHMVITAQAIQASGFTSAADALAALAREAG